MLILLSSFLLLLQPLSLCAPRTSVRICNSYCQRWSWLHCTHLDVSMKARPKGHIAIKLYEEVVKRPPQLRQKMVLTNAALLRFVIIVPIIGET